MTHIFRMHGYCRQWDNKKIVLIVSLVTVIALVWFISDNRNEYSWIHRYEQNSYRPLFELTCDPHSKDCSIIHLLMRQRNEASKKANELQQKVGRMQCQRNEKFNGSHTSDTGGWCHNSGQHFADENLAEALSELFKGKRVASFGDGPGKYKELLENSRKGITYDAYDGAPFCNDTSQGKVKFLDLTLYQYGLPMYDWVISLEVAEHIPREFENVYISNINRHAREGLVLSWAVPGQGGYAHINNHPLYYVVQIMKENGLHHNPEKSEVLKKAAKISWLKQNVNVYMRRQENQGDSMMHLLT
ncbi:hypothetical protein ACJMK2_006386 [Sinanodonta woodiana]|uniref:Methyltransferase type 11 domain-containing protein n=1 Tax=Sinanodonta woodiana TaxID=1069815 RepID=A0ABD3VT00_SINWO